MATNIVGATGIDKVQDGIIVNADIDTVAASKLTGALPAISAANLTAIPAGNLTGTVADARISALTASKLTGALPAISGASLTNLPADATKLPAAGGALTGNVTSDSKLTIGSSTVQGAKVGIYTGANNDIGVVADSSLHLANNTAADAVMQITFGTQSPSNTKAAGYIGFANTAVSSLTKGDLVFGTRSVETDTTPTERMRINSNGRVGIGDTSPDARLEVKATSETAFVAEATVSGEYTAIFKTASTNTTPLIDARDSSGGSLFKVQADGAIGMNVLGFASRADTNGWPNDNFLQIKYTEVSVSSTGWHNIEMNRQEPNGHGSLGCGVPIGFIPGCEYNANMTVDKIGCTPWPDGSSRYEYKVYVTVTTGGTLGIFYLFGGNA